jgi:hypothetical protein
MRWLPHAGRCIISSSLGLAQLGLSRCPVTMSKTLNRCDVLARIDRDIAEGERHVAEQIALIKWMIAECLDTTLAQSLLFNLEEILKHWHAHRQLILEANPQDQAHDF